MVFGTFKEVELDAGSERLEHTKSPFQNVNVSQCPDSHQDHKSNPLGFFHLIRFKNNATSFLMGVWGERMANMKWKKLSLAFIPYSITWIENGRLYC